MKETFASSRFGLDLSPDGRDLLATPLPEIVWARTVSALSS